MVLLIASLSCEKTANEPVSNSDEDIIKRQVKEVVTTIFKGCRDVNFDMVIESCYDSQDFIYVFNGTTLSYKEFTDALKDIYNKLLNQVVTIISEKFAVLDISTVVYTANCTFLENYKDGHTFVADPAVMVFIFKKIDGRWRWIYGVESYG